jgi:hypothetical protein
MSKRVVCTAEMMPNYIGHLLGTAQVCFTSDYPSRHPGTVNDRDVACLRQHAALLRWGNGELGPLTPFFVFFPAYLGFDNKGAIAEY